MESWLNPLFDVMPMPIFIGILIWTFSICLFSVFLSMIFILLNKRCSSMSEIITIKQIPMDAEKSLKDRYSCDSLSLMSSETTKNEIHDKSNSFYLKNSWQKKNLSRKINSLPSSKQNSMVKENRKLNTLPQPSTRRSIIRDLTCVSNSVNDIKIHQSVDSLFSKDSLIE